MKRIIFIFLLISSNLIGQNMDKDNCIRVERVYSTANFRELNNKDVCFKVKGMASEILTNKYCITDTGESLNVEINYFGLVRTEDVIAQNSNTHSTQIEVTIHFKQKAYKSSAVVDTPISDITLDFISNAFDATDMKKLIGLALNNCIEKLP